MNSKVLVTILKMMLLGVVTGPLMGCAYRMGAPERRIPGDYHTVFVPMFQNLTTEPGIEVFFTNALIQELERSRVAQVTPHEMAEVEIQGQIETMNHLSGGQRTSSEYPLLPEGSVLATGYRILINCNVNVVRITDKKVLWSGKINGERTYSSAQVGTGGINSVNPLYNLSAKRTNIESMAAQMMVEAHDRITENF